jgi:hypothetical protein
MRVRSAQIGLILLGFLAAGASCALDTAGTSRTATSTGAGAGAGGAGTTSAGGGSSGGGQGDLPASCKDVLQADPNAGDGLYTIDPDGPGPIPAFQAKCLMSREGGGFTRFHWVKAAYPEGADPLGEALEACDPAGSVCLGRIPASAEPTDLLVFEVTSGELARWTFDGTELSNAVLGALRDKQMACLMNRSPAFMPVTDTSTETYCSNGNKGGCDCFLYGMGECNGGSAWVMELDDDGYYCQSAFKMGATLDPQNNNCGPADHGYMDACSCTAEDGELYYR